MNGQSGTWKNDDDKRQAENDLAGECFVAGDLDLYEENFGITAEDDQALIPYRGGSLFPVDFDLSEPFELLSGLFLKEGDRQPSVSELDGSDIVSTFSHFGDFDDIMALRDAVENSEFNVSSATRAVVVADTEPLQSCGRDFGPSEFFDETGLVQNDGFENAVLKAGTEAQESSPLKRESANDHEGDLQQLRTMMENEEALPRSSAESERGFNKFVRDLEEIEALRSAVEGYGKPWTESAGGTEPLPEPELLADTETTTASDLSEEELRKLKFAKEFEELEALRIEVEQADFKRMRAALEDAENFVPPQVPVATSDESAIAARRAKDLLELEALRMAVETLQPGKPSRWSSGVDGDFSKMMDVLEQGESDQARRRRFSSELREMESLRQAVEGVSVPVRWPQDNNSIKPKLNDEILKARAGVSPQSAEGHEPALSGATVVPVPQPPRSVEVDGTEYGGSPDSQHLLSFRPASPLSDSRTSERFSPVAPDTESCVRDSSDANASFANAQSDGSVHSIEENEPIATNRSLVLAASNALVEVQELSWRMFDVSVAPEAKPGNIDTTVEAVLQLNSVTILPAASAIPPPSAPVPVGAGATAASQSNTTTNLAGNRVSGEKTTIVPAPSSHPDCSTDIAATPDTLEKTAITPEPSRPDSSVIDAAPASVEAATIALSYPDSCTINALPASVEKSTIVPTAFSADASNEIDARSASQEKPIIATATSPLDSFAPAPTTLTERPAVGPAVSNSISSIAISASGPSSSATTNRRPVRVLFGMKRFTLIAMLGGVIYWMCSIANSSQSFYEAGNAAYKAGNYRQAIKLFERSLAINPHMINARKYKARAFLALGLLDQALKQYNILLEVNPDDPDCLADRARIFGERNEWQLAIKDLDRLVALKKDLDVDQWREYAIAADTLGNLPLAIDAYEKAIGRKGDKDMRDLRLARSRCLRKSLLWLEAAEECTIILADSPNDRDALVERAHDYVCAREFAKANADLQSLLKMFPKDPEVHFVQGQFYAAQMDKVDAIKEFDVVLKLKPDWAVAVSRETDKMNGL